MNRRFVGLLLLALFNSPAPASDTDADGVQDSADAFPCDPQAAGVVHVPAEGEHGMLLFEDSWPSMGDFDFNDAAISYNYVLIQHANGGVTSVRLTLNVLAMGATMASGLALRLPVVFDTPLDAQLQFQDGAVVQLAHLPGETQLVIALTGDLRELFPGPPAGWINTTPSAPSVPGVALSLTVSFDSPQAIDVAQAPFDLFLYRVGVPGHQIHLPQYAGTDTMDVSLFGTEDDASTSERFFVNQSGIPWALSFPDTIAWPKEHVPIDLAYPDIVLFGASGGTAHEDYYQSNVVQQNLWTEGANGTPPPVPLIFVWPPARCEDGDVCTDDSCGPAGECVNTPRDEDGDGHVAASCGGSDCDDENVAVHELPPGISDLQWSSGTDLGWSPAGPATFYDLVRGALADLPAGSSASETCLLSGTATPVGSDATLPAAAGGYWYLARGRNSCGAGTYGAGSDGLPRVSTACP